MRYFLKKTSPSKKGTYLQIYKSMHVANKGSRNFCVKSLGYVSDLENKGIKDPINYYADEVKSMNEELESKTTQISNVSPLKNAGYFLLDAMLNKLSVDKDIDTISILKKFRYDVSSFIRMMIYAQVISPKSKRASFEKVIPNIYNAELFSYDQILDGIEYIGSDYQKYIEIFNNQIEKVYGRKTDNVFFDCTNYYFEIDLEDDLRKKGPSKENHKGPIVGQALLLDSDQIPLAMNLYPGNESEKPYLRKNIEDIKNKYDIKGRVVQVADKGLNCAKNIYAAVKEANDGYIFSKSIHGQNLPQSDKEWIIRDDKYNVWTNVFDASGNLKYKYKEIIETYEYSFLDDEDKKQTFKVKEKRIVTFNPSLASKKIREINKEVDKIRTTISIKKEARKELGDSVKYVDFTATNKDGEKIKIDPKINYQKIEEDKLYAGYNLLVTSEINLSAREIYDIYHGLWKIEESFRIMKTHLEARPVYLQKHERIYGHFLICYLALTILRLLEIKTFDRKLSTSEIIEFIRNYYVVETDENQYINVSTTSKVYELIKEQLGLSKLGKVKLNKKNINSFFECDV